MCCAYPRRGCLGRTHVTKVQLIATAADGSPVWCTRFGAAAAVKYQLPSHCRWRLRVHIYRGRSIGLQAAYNEDPAQRSTFRRARRLPTAAIEGNPCHFGNFSSARAIANQVTLIKIAETAHPERNN